MTLLAAAIAVILALAPSSVPLPGAGAWPTGGPVGVLRGFDPPPRPWLAGHRGIDLAAAPGDPVHSPMSGVVVFTGLVADRPVVVVAAGDVRVSLEPVAPDLAAGARVAAGEIIGRVAPGNDHCRGTSCLHWGLRIADVYHDPLLLVQHYRAVLLP